MNKSICVIILFFCSVSLNAQVVFYISPAGNDLNSGTMEQPFSSLTAARDAIRNYKKDHASTDSFVVTIADGTYTMREPFVLTPEDGGTPDCPIVYKAALGATPIFSGGKKISGFTVNENGVWEAKIPECSYYKWRFDQLYVNDKRATLARTPNKGFLKIDSVKQIVWERGTGRAPEKAQQILWFDNDNFKSIQDLSDDDLKLIRFRAYHKWDFTIRHIDKIDNDSLAIFTSGQGMKPWNPIKKNNRIVFENYAAALDTVGEWFLNNDGILSYIPLPGQTPENTEIIAPVLENLMFVEGDLSNNKFVEYIKFEGLTFKHCHYQIPQTGFEPNQAAVKISSAVMLEGVKNITFSNDHLYLSGKGGEYYIPPFMTIGVINAFKMIKVYH